MTYKSNGKGDMAHDADIVVLGRHQPAYRRALCGRGTDARCGQLVLKYRRHDADGSPMAILQLIVNGIALGALYALITLGFVFVINATGAVNFAQGELVMAGGYAAVVLQSVFSAGPLILLAVAVVMFFVGLVLALVAYFPLMRRPPATVFISTLLCGIFLQSLFVILFGPEATRRAAVLLLLAGAARRDRDQPAVGRHRARRRAPDRAAVRGVQPHPDRPQAARHHRRTARWRRRSASRRCA